MNTTNTVSIQPIDKTTVNQICSGQVVLNLATAVKELLENSIDAGANSIQIKLEEYGSESVEVIDNGCGVEEVNFQALTLKHHTSKIKEFEDLYSVETFGFRGEALSSLCSLCDVTITTQHVNAVIGATLKFDHNGIITSNVKTLRKVGTTVKLENLFSTLPIRRTEFLKNLKREFSKLCNVLYSYGLQSIGVRITCTNHTSKTKLNAKETLNENVKKSTNTIIMDTKGESVELNIVSIFGVKQKQNLLHVTEIMPSEETLNEFNLLNKNLDLKKFKLDGYISSCAHGCGRTSSDRQFFFINSRPIDNSKITKLVNDVYHQYNNKQEPFVVLNIKVVKGSYDMNITPDKRQILLQNETLLLAVLKESLHGVFKNIPSTLEVQNLGLSKSFSNFTERGASPAGLEKFKSNFRNLSPRNEKLEQSQSRIDNLLTKFRPQTSSTTNDSTSRLHFSSKRKPESDSSMINREVFHVPQTQKFEITETIKEIMKIDETPQFSNNCTQNEPKTYAKYSDLGTETSKSKNAEKFEKYVIIGESGESEPKRMKFDEGLSQEIKDGRKCVYFNITVQDIKNEYLKKTTPKEERKCEGVKFLSEIKPQNNERAEHELKREISKDSFKRMEIIGQFNLGFIITKLNSDIFIIDQHASDEKYNFETLQSTTIMQTQKLIKPETLELTVDKEELMLQHADVIKKNGFDFVFDENGLPTRRVSLTVIPYSKRTVFGKEDVDELLFFLENDPEFKNCRPSRLKQMFASRACRKSVMIGTPLNHQEMRKIVNHMGEIEQPWNCPHGRPTMRHLINLTMVYSEE